MVHKVRTRVRFKDGSEEVRLWGDDGWFFPPVLVLRGINQDDPVLS